MSFSPLSKPPVDPSSWKGVKLFAMDVDGILTDGSIMISSDGSETKAFNVLDGMGLTRLAKATLNPEAVVAAEPQVPGSMRTH